MTKRAIQKIKFLLGAGKVTGVGTILNPSGTCYECSPHVSAGRVPAALLAARGAAPRASMYCRALFSLLCAPRPAAIHRRRLASHITVM